MTKLTNTSSISPTFDNYHQLNITVPEVNGSLHILNEIKIELDFLWGLLIRVQQSCHL